MKVEGRKIANSFWGKSWCENLERYSDFASRLPRGRSYVRNGSVVDLKIGEGEVAAKVCGSELYTVKIKVTPVKAPQWRAICRDCAGSIDSLVELLQGRFAKSVMERVCSKGDGLFPAPDEIKLSCSCPDWADMCKHVAAALYGVGARLDEKPELLFVLRNVDEKELLAGAGRDLAFTQATAGRKGAGRRRRGCAVRVGDGGTSRCRNTDPDRSHARETGQAAGSRNRGRSQEEGGREEGAKPTRGRPRGHQGQSISVRVERSRCRSRGPREAPRVLKRASGASASPHRVDFRIP